VGIGIRIKRAGIPKKILFICSSVIIFFIALEFLFRIFPVSKLPEDKIFTDVYDPQYQLLPGAKNPWIEAEEKFNDEGFRGKQITVQRLPGVMRIITVGDSTAFGTNVQADETFTFLLEKQLIEKGMQVEALNAGVPGTNIWQQRLLFEKQVVKFRPDLVILYTAVNTRPDFFKYRRAMEKQSSTFLLKKILDKSAFYKFLKRKIHSPNYTRLTHQYIQNWGGKLSDTAVPAQFMIEDARIDLEGFSSMCNEIGARLLVIGVIPREIFDNPQRFAKRTDSLSSENFINENAASIVPVIAKELGLDTFAPEASFMKAAKDTELFLDACHFTPAGHKVMADALAIEICEKNLLPEKCPE